MYHDRVAFHVMFMSALFEMVDNLLLTGGQLQYKMLLLCVDDEVGDGPNTTVPFRFHQCHVSAIKFMTKGDSAVLGGRLVTDYECGKYAQAYM